MPLVLDEVMEVVRAHELDGEDRKGWVQIPAGNARSFPKRIYVHRPADGRAVREIHLSGFSVPHAGIAPLSREEATRRHLGRVQGIIDARNQTDDVVLDALSAALREVSLSATPVAQPRRKARVESGNSNDAIQLPDVASDELDAWMSTRLGYGSLNARGWFLGMEEACEDAMELPSRIAGGALEDLEDALTRIGRYAHLLQPNPSLQSTWAPLIRSWLVAAEGIDSPTTDDVRDHQRNRWGRTTGDTLLVELLPLPSPSVQDWPYEELGVGTRAEYQRRWLPSRTELLARLWRESPTTPRVAVAYGRSYWDHYRSVFGLHGQTGEPLVADDPTWALGFRLPVGGAVLVRHPVAFGNSNARWEALGRWLRGRLAR